MRAPTNTTRALLLNGVTVLLPGLLAACGKGSESRNSNVTDTTAAAVTTAQTGATSRADVVANPAISKWTDSNIVARLEAGDKTEVQLGQLAESKAIIPGVTDFAKMLVTDHSQSERDVRSRAAMTKLGAKPASDDTTAREGEELLKKFAAMPKGTDWDSTFVQHEFDEHQRDIADTKAMQNQAKDPQLKQLLGNELPVLQKHLDAAQKLLGNTPGGSAAWHNAEFRKTERAKSAKAKP